MSWPPSKRLVRYAIVILAGMVVGCHADDRKADEAREVNVIEIVDAAKDMQPVYGITLDGYEDFLKAGYNPPKDPVTGKRYEYRRKDQIVTVCTDFDFPSVDFNGTSKVVYGDPVVHGFGTWTHGGGHQCLTRDVTPPADWKKISLIARMTYIMARLNAFVELNESLMRSSTG